MPLTSEQEWTLVSCGLLALADRVLTGGEASRLLAMVESYLDPEEQDRWMDLVADKAALEAHFEQLRPPPAENHLALLERVWGIALADGDASLTEIRVFERIGERLSIEGSQLMVHRKTWTYAAMERSEVVAGFVANLLQRGAKATAEEHAFYETLIGRLPLSKSRRARILGEIDTPPSLESIAAILKRFSRAQQLETLRSIADAVTRTERREAAREQMVEFVATSGLPATIVDGLHGFVPTTEKPAS
ncbi:MAG TPA: hypothetical protein ENJ18_04345 [Nannocystis exedens]|nr:hypothetical protein [Nannocystis exedens]